MCKELANLYEKQLYDYNKLSSILRTQARFCDNILNQLRPEPEYFRVGFYGLSFPLFVRVSYSNVFSNDWSHLRVTYWTNFGRY